LLLGACSGPGSAASSAPTNTAWVATDASLTLPGTTLTPVDLATRAPGAAITVGSLPSAMAFTADDAALLVVSQGDDTLHEIDPVSRQVVRSVAVGVAPDAVAVAPGGTNGKGIALVANLDANSVTPVDLGAWHAGKTITVGTQPVAIAVTTSSAGATALVVDFGSDEVTPISLSTMQAGPPIAVGPSPETIAVVPGQAIVGNFGDRSLTPINATTLQSGPAVALPVDPTAIAVGSGGTTVYVAGGASIVPVTVAALAVGAPITLPYVVEALALNASGAMGWAALANGSLVSVSLPTGVVGVPIHLGGHPSAIVIASK
jgi:YVTN family beta-propeller protein